METPYEVTTGRKFTKLEQQMIWRKPASHQTSEEELRIATEIKENWQDPELKIFNVLLEGDAGSGKTQLAKALSYDLQLPYTKVTCFADMDKSDVFGALLPVVAADNELDEELLQAVYQTDSLQDLLQLIQRHYSISATTAKEKLAELVARLESQEQEPVQYKFYPSEIVRALEKGYLLEIQEPTVIRDASVLVALNSALESGGMLNLPTGVIRRHPDCVIIVTTNRNYQGNRPLNESLRDRMQHAEKMDLPSLDVMVARGQAKTGFEDRVILRKMAEVIRLLDETAKANAIKGVAGMRSYFYWVNTAKQGQNVFDSLYPKVLYKLTTDPSELHLLEEALAASKLLTELRILINSQPLSAFKNRHLGRRLSQEEADARNIMEEGPATLKSDAVTTEAEADASESPEESATEEAATKAQALPIESDERSGQDAKAQKGQEADTAQTSRQDISIDDFEAADKNKRSELNKEVRDLLKDSIHAKEGTLVHRPKFSQADVDTAHRRTAEIQPTVDQLVRKLQDVLENEQSTQYNRGKYSGSRFDASRVAYGDYRTFENKAQPHEQPSLAVAIRVDESGSMVRDDRIDAARMAALAVTRFAEAMKIPLLVYGDTADLSDREKTSLYSYKEFSDDFTYTEAKLMTMKPRQNNRDGSALRVIAGKLAEEEATTKLLINISDGQPKALPDYTGAKAQEDIQQVLADYERQGVIFLAAAIGDDKEAIRQLYGEGRFIDISDLQHFPEELVSLIIRYF